MKQVTCSVHNGMYTLGLLLYGRAAVVVVVDAHDEVPGTSY